jgi:hypothetical protein
MSNPVKAGLALVSVAVLAIIGFLIIGQKPPSATCKVSAAGVALLADTIKQKGTAFAIEGAAGGAIAANEACDYLLKQLDKDSEKKQPVEVETNSGVVQAEISKRDLTTPPPPPPTATKSNVDVSRIVDCVVAYDVKLLQDLCIDRKISPEQGPRR